MSILNSTLERGGEGEFAESGLLRKKVQLIIQNLSNTIELFNKNKTNPETVKRLVELHRHLVRASERDPHLIYTFSPKAISFIKELKNTYSTPAELIGDFPHIAELNTYFSELEISEVKRERAEALKLFNIEDDPSPDKRLNKIDSILEGLMPTCTSAVNRRRAFREIRPDVFMLMSRQNPKTGKTYTAEEAIQVATTWGIRRTFGGGVGYEQKTRYRRMLSEMKPTLDRARVDVGLAPIDSKRRLLPRALYNPEAHIMRRFIENEKFLDATIEEDKYKSEDGEYSFLKKAGLRRALNTRFLPRFIATRGKRYARNIAYVDENKPLSAVDKKINRLKKKINKAKPRSKKKISLTTKKLNLVADKNQLVHNSFNNIKDRKIRRLAEKRERRKKQAEELLESDQKEKARREIDRKDKRKRENRATLFRSTRGSGSRLGVFGLRGALHRLEDQAKRKEAAKNWQLDASATMGDYTARRNLEVFKALPGGSFLGPTIGRVTQIMSLGINSVIGTSQGVNSIKEGEGPSSINLGFVRVGGNFARTARLGLLGPYAMIRGIYDSFKSRFGKKDKK